MINQHMYVTCHAGNSSEGKPLHLLYNKQQQPEASRAASCLTTKPQFARLSRRSPASISCKSETPTRTASTPTRASWLRGACLDERRWIYSKAGEVAATLEITEVHLKERKENPDLVTRCAGKVSLPE